ncbi:Mucin-associated surface protein (MASP) subgroup S074 [Trypanosoma cruzi]|uniref:Mucin-associated surface protein (MASP) subgroup S074 n=1 Tax=Trypanosoma cruzi TaxID=5693 RepID=A0A7J6XQJ2_TRYCR|nr:Mucin-associated surface protein (MASP) subgroup S074 [Trypanosoma cruzi]
MAMMMTGRVLLVCALCVLWCGAGGGFGIARDNRCIEGDGNVLTHMHNGGNNGLRLTADCGLFSTRMGLIKAVAAGDGSRDENGNDLLENEDKSPQGGEPAGSGDNETPGPKGGNGAAGAATPPSPSGPGVPGAGAEGGQLPVVGQEGNENKNVDPNNKAATDSQDQTNDQLSSSSGSTPSPGEKPFSMGTSDIKQLPTETPTKGVVGPRNKSGDDEERDEEETRKEKEENKLQSETQERGNNAEVPQSLPAQPSGGPAPPPPLPPSSEGEESPTAEKESSQKVTKAKNENTPSEFKTDSEAPEPSSGDATQEQHSHDTDTEDSTKNAATGSPAEPTSSSTSTSGSGDNVHNKADEDDAQSSEGQHDSLETGNTNVVPTLSETAPQTATANTTDTANTQNSDGSTAVSHTTSPLLILLLVACAAAAAVVAA